jgi:hypothetical protein
MRTITAYSMLILFPVLCSCASELTPEEQTELETVELAMQGMPKEVMCAQIQREWLCDHAGCTWSWSGCVQTSKAAGDEEVVSAGSGLGAQEATLAKTVSSGGAVEAAEPIEGAGTFAAESKGTGPVSSGGGVALPTQSPKMCSQILVQWLCMRAGCTWDRTAVRCTHPPIAY